MLFLNVYYISQRYGGPEEGGWYYDVAKPIGSIPTKTKYEHGKRCCVSSDAEGDGRETKVTISICDCYVCDGTGEVEDDAYEQGVDASEQGVMMVRCKCGLIPDDLQDAAKLCQQMVGLIEEEITLGRHDHIHVCFEDCFAVHFDHWSRYE